ncbi:MAG: helix-turn-helix transcriptional regulator [Chloroflexi bacterium]|nr:helix-turn-helix transcriptional regulator [Chloroflexota bacterium]MBI3734009.1 helix-turn-helix transcriptional regulator [Chloroflexota bacterium]
MFPRLRELKRFFAALTSASRLRIIEQLARAGAEVSVGELADRLRMSQPLVSWHLRGLRRASLVQIRRAGRQAFCSLNREQLAHYQRLFTELLEETK